MPPRRTARERSGDLPPGDGAASTLVPVEQAASLGSSALTGRLALVLALVAATGLYYLTVADSPLFAGPASTTTTTTSTATAALSSTPNPDTSSFSIACPPPCFQGATAAARSAPPPGPVQAISASCAAAGPPNRSAVHARSRNRLFYTSNEGCTAAHVDAGVCFPSLRGRPGTFDCAPDMVIVGAMKAATGLVREFLLAHPALASSPNLGFSSEGKEINFFSTYKVDEWRSYLEVRHAFACP